MKTQRVMRIHGPNALRRSPFKGRPGAIPGNPSISAADDKEGNLALSTSIFDMGQQFSKLPINFAHLHLFRNTLVWTSKIRTAAHARHNPRKASKPHDA